MKWQKNTGVMPCEGETPVAYKTVAGNVYYRRAGDIMWSDTITHYCILDVPPFDYVEPKVWTVELINKGWHLLKHGLWHMTISEGSDDTVDALLDALNAWEERNGTH